MNPLDGCYLKLARSQEHLDGLNNARQRIVEEHGSFPFALTGKANSQRTKYFFTVYAMADPPLLEWGIIVGDAVHSLRSALDQMVYGTASDPTGRCAFPIFSTEKDWEIESPGILWSVPEPLRTLIKAAQPYHLGDAAETHPLAMLRLLSNLDKHRTIPTTAFIPVSVEAKITKTVGIKSYKELRIKSGKPLEPGAVIAEIKIEADDSGIEPYMDMDSYFEFEVAFGKGPIPSPLYLKPVVTSFNETVGSYVFTVIRKASAIIEPDVERPEHMTMHEPPAPEGEAACD